MKSSHLLSLALAFLAMALFGWSLGGKSNSTPDSSALSQDHSARLMRSSRPVAGPKGEAAERLTVIRNSRDPSERTRATIALANSLSPGEFAPWLDGNWFKQRDGADATLFKTILMYRWVQEDMDGFLLWGIKNEDDAVEGIIGSLATKDPQRLLDFFKLHPNEQAELTALAAIANENPSLALQRLLQMDRDGIVSDSYLCKYVIDNIAKQSPATLEAVLDSLPPSLKVAAETRLIGQKMETDFSSELKKLLARPDGAKLFSMISSNSDSKLLNVQLIDELANLPASWRALIGSSAYKFVDQKCAAKWVTADLEGLGFTEVQARSIREESIEDLSRTDPETAIQLMPEAGLKLNQEQRYLRNIFEVLREEPEKAEKLMALLTTDEDRQIARDVLIQKPTEQKEEITQIEDPAAWLQAVGSLKSEDSAYEYSSMLSSWDADKLADLPRQFQSLPEDQKANVARGFLSAGDYDHLIAEAARYFISHPEVPLYRNSIDLSDQKVDGFNANPNQEDQVSQSIELASHYVAKTAVQDPESTAQWIQSLPNGAPKLWASKNLQSIWSQYDPEAAEQWMKSLPTATQSQIQNLKSNPDSSGGGF